MDKKREEVKQWFREAKFGLFIHWGIYAVTGRGEWLRQTEQVPEEEYAKQIPLFTAKHFDPKAWAKLARETGMKYVVFTTKHHDGFCMFDAHNTDWKVTNSPAKRDVLRELTEAFLAEGLKVGYYYSIMDWHHPDYLPRMTFEQETRPAEGHNVMDYIAYMRDQIHQILTEYGEAPFVLWYDGGWMNAPEELGAAETNALARKWKPGLLINDRHHTKEDLITPEQRVPATGILDDDGKPALWEACMTMTSHWWGYDRNETKFKEPEYLIQTLVDMVSKGGNYLLNIGPDAEGVIQPEFVERMKAIGKWMDKYGEAIYGTTASPFGKLPFFGKVTVKGTRLYVHLFVWPKKLQIRLPNLKNDIKAITLLQSKDAVTAVRDGADWVITLPEAQPDPVVSVLAVDLDGAPQVEPVRITPKADGVIDLPILYGDLIGPHGQRIRYEIDQRDVYVGSWYRAPDRISWTIEDVPEDGDYDLTLFNYVNRSESGMVYDVYVNPERRPAFAPNGKPWGAEDAKKLFLTPPQLSFTARSSANRVLNRRPGAVHLKKGRNVLAIVLGDAKGHTEDGICLFGAMLKSCLAKGPEHWAKRGPHTNR